MNNDLKDALDRLETARVQGLQAVAATSSTAELENVRVQYTGKKSSVSQVTQVMGRLDPNDRKQLGAAVNAAKSELEAALSRQHTDLGRREQKKRFEQERVDVTLPGTPFSVGFRHPLLLSVREILGILERMGYDVYEGPDVEWERYNFDLLNTPKHHPARDVQDTFWVDDDMVLRTQTSPAQIRYMESHQPPIRAAMPGFCYRNEAEDASHADRFYQIEGLAVDTDIRLTDLKGTMTEICRLYFGEGRQVRFRPHYFPFTEPSAELDIECSVCHGTGCRSCGGEGWLELGGSGMVHPNVLRAVGYDPEKVSGFAFGIGPDRYTMMKYGITDLRLFREDDLRFVAQFN
ncbi:MAG TPA: phenylalanine--tRNA ligase subunit alpha [Chloroflexota bacterium]